MTKSQLENKVVSFAEILFWMLPISAQMSLKLFLRMYQEHPKSTKFSYAEKFWTKFGLNDTICSCVCRSLIPLGTNSSINLTLLNNFLMDLERHKFFKFQSIKPEWFATLSHKVRSTVVFLKSSHNTLLAPLIASTALNVIENQ